MEAAGYSTNALNRMTTHARAVVDPAILRWARTSAGLDHVDAAKALGTSAEIVAMWESDAQAHPSMPQLREMARVYKRRLSDFFLPAPPEDAPIPHDFRREPGEVAEVYSRALRYELRAAAERRDLALDFYDELNEDPPELDATIARWDNPAEVARIVRKNLLKITPGEQATWRDPRIHYNAWRQRLEGIGILVFQVTSVPTDEMWGFSFGDKRPLPVIGVNRKLAYNGRTFTMLHELTHVLVGQPSLCDIDEEQRRRKDEQRTEVFCNAVAAALLMPEPEFLRHEVVAQHGSGKENWQDYELKQLGQSFGASEEAVVRRLLTFHRTTKDFYQRKRSQYQHRIFPDRDPSEEMKRNMPQEVISNFGRTFTRLVLDTYSSERVSLSDVSRFLGLRAEQVSKVRALLTGA